MKKTWKRLCTGFLALATVVTALPTTPVHAESKQYWTESKERVGIVEKVMNDGSIGSTFNGVFSDKDCTKQLATLAGLSVFAAVPLFMLSGVLVMETWLRVLLIVIGAVVVCGGISIACILDREAGAFECPDCHNRFVPDMKSYVMGLHTMTKRKLVCPHCGAHKYCKKVLTR